MTTEQAHEKFASDALMYGYSFFAVGERVWRAGFPASNDLPPVVEETEIRIDPATGDFVAWVVIKSEIDPAPLTIGGQVALFADPVQARIQAARNAGHAVTALEFSQLQLRKQQSKIILPASCSTAS